MVSSISNSPTQSPVTKVLEQQAARNEAVREQEAERLAQQAKIQEALRDDQIQRAKDAEERRGQTVDINV